MANTMLKTPRFADEIRKTGFVLENVVSQQLKSAGWTVISNKYYVDDAEDTVREIDLIGYKCTKVLHFDVYTTLVISCKKSESNVWALMSRDINLKDPNADWWPLHVWSNDKALTFKLSEPSKSIAYHKNVAELGVTDALSDPSVEVFAHQEMDKKSGKPQNDKAIFASITSLIKAQAYELTALPGRKKSASIYQFNLLSIVDSDLIRLMFSGDDIVESGLESEHYFTRYIVKKRESFSRIRFIKSSAFETILQDYSRLHSANCKWYAAEHAAFYDGLIKDHQRTQVLADDFKRKIQFEIAMCIDIKYTEVSRLTVNWSAQDENVWIGITDIELGDIELLNASTRVHDSVSRALISVYRYHGAFEFLDDIPF
jgi:hypothetical protein